MVSCKKVLNLGDLYSTAASGFYIRLNSGTSLYRPQQERRTRNGVKLRKTGVEKGGRQDKTLGHSYGVGYIIRSESVGVRIKREGPDEDGGSKPVDVPFRTWTGGGSWMRVPQSN